jgi:hypothetical protein
LNGTTALLKMLFEDGIRSLGMMGLESYRQTTSEHPAGLSCQGILGRDALDWVINNPCM